MEMKLIALAKRYPILVLCGPRQSGKSTLVKKVFKEHQYISLEDPDQREFATQDPRGFLSSFEKKIIIDEVQNVPTLFSYIQGIVDFKKIKAQFILTGSSQLDLLEGVTQSLAGRAAIFHLLPLTIKEAGNSKFTKSLEQAIFAGSYPSVHFDKIPIYDWYKDYLVNYLERDVRKILNIKDLGTFQIFLKMCAARSGQIINYSSFANDCGISPNTAKEWMNILEASYIIFRLNPFYKNFSKRLIKSPKLYFYDTGVACSLLSITSPKELLTHTCRGSLFESFLISELKKKYFNLHKSAPFYFWRDNKGLEVDLIIEKSEKFSLIEMKSSKTIDANFFKSLNYLAALAPHEALEKILIFGGSTKLVRFNTKVIPWNFLDDLSI